MTDNPNPGKPPETKRSLADMVAPVEQASFSRSFPPATLIKVAVLALLVVLLNDWQFIPMFKTWRVDANWNHGFLIPLFSLFLIYSRRNEIISTKRRICLWGLPVVLMGMLMLIAAFGFVHNMYLCNISILVLAFGLVLYLAGPQMAKLMWLPIFFLIFAMPLPELLYQRIAFPLQNFAAKGAAVTLNAVGINVTVSSSNLWVPSSHVPGKIHPLTVAEACSGVRSLVAYLALGVAWAYLQERPIWQRLTLAIAAAPIAIITNVARVAITGFWFYIDKEELGKNFMHDAAGIVMLIPAGLMFWGLSSLLSGLFVEVDEDEDQDNDQGSKTHDPSQTREVTA